MVNVTVEVLEAALCQEGSFELLISIFEHCYILSCFFIPLRLTVVLRVCVCV